jgi:hypothetical protein
MKKYIKLRLGGIALLIVPPLILAAEIARQLAAMNPPSWGQLKLRWAFIVFYAMAGGLVMLIFARNLKEQEIKDEEGRKRYKEMQKKNIDSA